MKRKKVFYFVLCLMLAAATVFALAACKEQGKDEVAEKDPSSIAGTSWVYDEHTSYDFKADKSGCMHIDGVDYPYTYRVDGDQLSLDFELEALHDCVYTYSIEGDQLKLIGGEGTIGGTYRLKRA